MRDNSGDMDGDFAYVTALDGRAPSNPKNGGTVPKTRAQLTMSSATASPWACSWRVPAQKATYQLEAKVYDAQSSGWSEVSTVTSK